MNDYSDKELACYLLESRKNGGASGYYKAGWQRWLSFAVSLAILLGILALIQLWMVFWLVLGVYVGILVRDRTLFNGLQASWPFYIKVLDWSKVEKIANEESST